MDTDFKSLAVFADGGSRGNPGKAASGFVIYSLEKVETANFTETCLEGALGKLPFCPEYFTKKIAENGKFLNIATNNQAEWDSIISALQKILELEIEVKNLELKVFMDSLLVIQQAKGVYKVKNAGLIPLANQFRTLAKNFPKINFYHIYREYNREADFLVNQVLDNLGKN